MRLPTIAALGILVIAPCLHAQAPDTLWTRSYGAVGDAFAISVIAAPGGGYVVGGSITRDSVKDATGWADTDFWVLRLDEQGDTLWTRSYGDSLWAEHVAQLVATNDGGFLVAGDRQRAHSDDLIYAVKADAEGTPMWEEEYSAEQSYVGTAGIDQMVEGDFIIAFNTWGSAEDFGAIRAYGGWGDALDGAGGEVFNIQYQWARTDVAGAVTATSDKGFAVCGWTTSLSDYRPLAFLMKSNEYGLVEWTRTYDSAWVSEVRRVRQTTDGGFIMIGDARDPIDSGVDGLYLLRTNADGDKVWSRMYGGNGGLDVIELPDGGFLATGWGGFTVRVSSSGELIWSESYGFGGTSLSVAPSPDGGYVLAGWRKTQEDKYEILIVGLAPDRIPTSAGDRGSDILPAEVTLAQNYPNPFNPSTTIKFELPRSSHVRLEIFNVLGRRVRVLLDASQSAGTHRIEWDGLSSEGTRVGSGAYFYRLVAEDIVETKKMLLLK